MYGVGATHISVNIGGRDELIFAYHLMPPVLLHRIIKTLQVSSSVTSIPWGYVTLSSAGTPPVHRDRDVLLDILSAGCFREITSPLVMCMSDFNKLS